METIVGTPLQLSSILSSLDKNKKYELKEHRLKRSLSQNSYAWELITQMGNALNMSKEEVYLEMLKSYGQRESICMLSNVNPKGYFKYYEVDSLRMIKDREFAIYSVYKGSSEFDTKEMTIFINGIIQECEQLGIHTLTQAEVENMRLI